MVLNETRAAKYIGISRPTLANYRKQGIGPPCTVIKLPTGKERARYTKHALDEWLRLRVEVSNGYFRDA